FELDYIKYYIKNMLYTYNIYKIIKYNYFIISNVYTFIIENIIIEKITSNITILITIFNVKYTSTIKNSLYSIII
ncbi:unnamed protein product, partial [Heterotrigona itama]